MNGLEEVQACIKNFICEKQLIQKQIVEIEEKRTQLAGQRNEKKNIDSNDIKVSELGKQISELGVQSQKLQNKIDSIFHEVKSQVNLAIDNLIADGIRKIRLINEEIEELEYKISSQKERRIRHQEQRQEFFARFGRMPELSEKAVKESKKQEKRAIINTVEIRRLEEQAKTVEETIITLATTKREFKNGNWDAILLQTEPFYVEPFYVAEMESIEELNIEQFDKIEEMYVEEFVPLEEVKIEEVKETVEQSEVNPEIEELARAIVEEIAAQQARNLNVNEVEENVAEDIITFEEGTEKKEKVIIPLFGQRATISGIVIKIEDGQLVYKAQMSDDEEIKVYPAKLGEESVLLRDKQNREECKEILVSYAASEYKVFDKKLINKIDPLVCELLIECAEKYGYEPQELIYNYAMSFSNNEQGDNNVPNIIYNLSHIEKSSLTKKEKAIINKICRFARKNNSIDLIESFSGFKRIKYIFKRLFAVNNVKVLPEAKY